MAVRALRLECDRRPAHRQPCPQNPSATPGRPLDRPRPVGRTAAPQPLSAPAERLNELPLVFFLPALVAPASPQPSNSKATLTNPRGGGRFRLPRTKRLGTPDQQRFQLARRSAYTPSPQEMAELRQREEVGNSAAAAPVLPRLRGEATRKFGGRSGLPGVRNKDYLRVAAADRMV